MQHMTGSQHSTPDYLLCCLQTTCVSYLQAIVAFSHHMSAQLLAELMKPLDIARDPTVTALSACLLSLAQLGCLHAPTWQTALQYALKRGNTDAPGKVSQLSIMAVHMHACPGLAKRVRISLGT